MTTFADNAQSEAVRNGQIGARRALADVGVRAVVILGASAAVTAGLDSVFGSNDTSAKIGEIGLALAIGGIAVLVIKNQFERSDPRKL